MNPPIVTADLFDIHHAAVRVCDLQFRSHGKRRSFSGPCRTLRVAEDHVPVRDMLATPGKGCVLVVDGAGILRTGILGDRLAELARSNGWAGAIVFGAVRDTDGIDVLDFGVKALGATARRALDRGSSQADAPVTFGGVTFHPGEWIYADADAVLVSAAPLDVEGARGGTAE
jgi:regulator of ribonuclease activity A